MGVLKDLLVTGSARINGTLYAKELKGDIETATLNNTTLGKIIQINKNMTTIEIPSSGILNISTGLLAAYGNSAYILTDMILFKTVGVSGSSGCNIGFPFTLVVESSYGSSGFSHTPKFIAIDSTNNDTLSTTISSKLDLSKVSLTSTNLTVKITNNTSYSVTFIIEYTPGITSFSIT